jgi:hypothetical protein
MAFRRSHLLFSALLASMLTFFGWAALHLVPPKVSWLWLSLPGGLLSIPGKLLVAFGAALFSPHGFYGVEEFEWLVVPTNLVVYFLFFLWRSGRVAGKKSG